jgi:hypothetical protein
VAALQRKVFWQYNGGNHYLPVLSERRKVLWVFPTWDPIWVGAKEYHQRDIQRLTPLQERILFQSVIDEWEAFQETCARERSAPE